VTRSTDLSCIFTSTTVNYATQVAKFKAVACTQSIDSRCSSTFLKATFGKFAAVKAAYCNADYLVIHTSNAPHWTPYAPPCRLFKLYSAGRWAGAATAWAG
jgi:hypothetical protein